MSEAMQAVPDNHPLMIAWRGFQDSPAYYNAAKWAREPDETGEFLKGSLWRLFMEGWMARAAHEEQMRKAEQP